MKRTPLRSDPEKIRQWQERSRKPIERKAKIRPVNPERQRRLRVRNYHSDEFIDWIHGLSCVVNGCGSQEIEASHIRSRGAGGRWEDVVPMCRAHHREFHDMGVRTWSSKYALSLDLIARAYASVWRERTGEPTTATSEAKLPDQSQPPEGETPE